MTHAGPKRRMAPSMNAPSSRNATDHDLTGVVFGFTLGFGFFVICHAVQRTRKLCAFTIMTWLTILVTSVSASMVFFNLENVVNRPLAYYIILSTLCLLSPNQSNNKKKYYLVSRIVLIWWNPNHVRWLRWGVFSWVGLINISAATETIISSTNQIPARLRISEAYAPFSAAWEPFECIPIDLLVKTKQLRLHPSPLQKKKRKTLCLLTDTLLNVVFILSVRKTLISNGLTKYNELVKFNVLVIGFSIAFVRPYSTPSLLLMNIQDVGIVSSMSGFIFYRRDHCAAGNHTLVTASYFPCSSLPYESLNSLSGFVKLKTELLMNELIVKVTQSENEMRMGSSMGNNLSTDLQRTNTRGHSKAGPSLEEKSLEGAGERKQAKLKPSRPQLRMCLTAPPPGGSYRTTIGTLADLETAHSSSIDLIHSPSFISRSHRSSLATNSGWEIPSVSSSFVTRLCNEPLIPVKY
ncbi:uncharacterized protein VP01_701g2 [Puccinia sorghi]|uniref:Uncharacterized protein n=1 Tax=Puccinia sorghi TaxID=27349 RepID=A0A0L6UDW0_9BASI|nr:uncharacterized protein VP01_701g2 [Puccinia sorghi]